MKPIKYLILSAALTLTAIFGLALQASAAHCPANATAQQLLQCGADHAGGQTNANPDRIEGTIENLINILSILIGFVAVVMIMVAGFRYITSGGDSNRISSAKNTLVMAIIGLFIVAIAQVLVRFVINTATDTTPPAGSGSSSGSPRTPGGGGNRDNQPN